MLESNQLDQYDAATDDTVYDTISLKINEIISNFDDIWDQEILYYLIDS